MLQVYLHRLRRYFGAFLVQLGGQVDAIVFSAGMGENSSILRDRALQGLEVCFQQQRQEILLLAAVASTVWAALVMPAFQHLSIRRQESASLKALTGGSWKPADRAL